MIWPIWSRVASLNCRTNSPMFTWAWPRAGPTGGAGFAWPPVICNFNLRATRRPRPLPIKHLSLEFGYLVEGELHRRLAPEDRDQNLQPRLVHVYVRDGAGKVRERAADDLDRLTDLVVHGGLDLLAGLDLAGMQQPLDLGPAQGRRLLPGPDDLGYARRLPHELPGVLVHVHVDEDVPGELALRRRHLLAVLDLDDVLRRDPYLPEVSPHAERLDPALQRRADLVLVTRICIYYVPLLHCKTLLMLLREDQTREDLEEAVPGVDVDGQRQDYDQDHRRALPQLVAVGPVDPSQLDADVLDEPLGAA